MIRKVRRIGRVRRVRKVRSIRQAGSTVPELKAGKLVRIIKLGFKRLLSDFSV